MKDTVIVVSIIWKSFKVWLSVVVAFPDSRQSSDAQWAEAYDVCCSHVVDVRSDPTSIVKLE
jgi:hypothetical protein